MAPGAGQYRDSAAIAQYGEAEMNHPKTLYHYTSQKGLLGILKGKKIWATHIQYLNDSTEFHYAIELAGSVLKRTDDTICRDLCQLTDELFSNPQLPDVFVTSFSVWSDDLNQWRAYCPRLGGFAIGFDKEQILSICRKDRGTLGHCEYSRRKQEKRIGELISQASATSKGDRYIDSDETSHDLDEILELIGKSRFDFALGLLSVAPFLKHSKFKAEAEWRLAITRKSDSKVAVCYREGGAMIVPYIELRLVSGQNDFLPIKEIVVGPCPNQTLSKMAVEKLVSDHGIYACEVVPSTVPYRPW